MTAFFKIQKNLRKRAIKWHPENHPDCSRDENNINNFWTFKKTTWIAEITAYCSNPRATICSQQSGVLNQDAVFTLPF
jgi:hypothetical protein